MKMTAAVLRKLQDYYASLDSRPTYKDAAQAAHMPIATAARYLNGTNQTGELERVRALCIVLDRHDLLEELPDKQNFGSPQEIIALIREIQKSSRESNLEELDRVRKLHEESEKRLMAELDRAIKSKDHAINEYTKRIERLEADKGTQSVINTELNTEMKVVRDTKRKRDNQLLASFIVNIVLLVLFIVYLIVFDVPNPGYGIFR